MLAEERQRVILRVLEEKRAATVAVLCRETGASEATIRRDLNELDRQGKLNKVAAQCSRSANLKARNRMF